MSYDSHLTEERRAVLLRALSNAAQYAANAQLLQRYCDRVGLSASSDRIEQDLAWLREQGLVTLTQSDGVTIGSITVRGLDVATGRTRVPGIPAPAPGAA